MENKKRRRLAAIMFTDIVGYSRIMQEDEQKGGEIRRRHRKVFEEINHEHEGELLQYFGDGTLSIFPSAASAVECAVKMQREFQVEPKVPLRIGIHTGDITFTDDDAYGHGMNIAARIETMCIPGGVYISGKVHEDIVNHHWLKAESLGYFELKNINDAIEILAITNEGINAPEYEIVSVPDIKTNQPELMNEGPVLQNKRNKWVAALLSFFLGIFGVHRFYLGQRYLGLAYITPAIIGMILGIWFLIAIPAIVGFIDSIIFASLSKSDFNQKYNMGVKMAKIKPPTFGRRRKEKPKEIPAYEPAKPRKKKILRPGTYEKKIARLQEELKQEPENAGLHMDLACAYSMQEDAKNGFYHLSKAVEYGYDDFTKIKNHYTLAFLRSKNDFKTFEKNGFRLIKMLPSPQENLLDSERPLLLEKLERIENLGEMLYRGEISEEQFTKQKRRLLDG